jgi:alpha-beta hydrolase superfamily lysophospholipase
VTARVFAGRLAGWADAAGARLEPVRYARPAAGGEVAGWRLSPSAPRGRVVAAHGAGNDALYPQIAAFKALVEAGFEVFAFDMDGHGRDSTTTFAPDTAPSALPAAVAEAERDRPPLPLHLLGHSFGGSLVLGALSEGSVPGVRSATIISSPIQVAPTFRTGIAELLGFLNRATLAQREHYGLWGIVPAFGPVKRGAYPFRRSETTGGSFGYVGAVQQLLDRLDIERTARRITTPVLLVYGTADRLVAHEQGERLARAIPGAELLTVDRTTHWSTCFEPGAVRRIVAWMESHQGDRTMADAEDPDHAADSDRPASPQAVPCTLSPVTSGSEPAPAPEQET